MEHFQQVSGNRHIYRVKAWQRWLYLLLGAAMGLGGIFVVGITKSETDPLAGLLASLPLVAVGVFLFAMALRSRIVIEGSRIEVRNVFGEKTADLSQIEGFRTVSSRNGSYTFLYLKENRGKISFSNFFDTDDDYRAWFQQVTDLDKRDRDAVLEEISRDTELGATPEERLAALKQAKTLSIVALVVTIAAAAGVNLDIEALHLPSAWVLALAPVVALLLVQRSPLLYAFFKRKTDPRAEISFLLMAAGFGLLIRCRGVEMVSIRPLLNFIVPIVLVFSAMLFNSVRKSSSVFGAILGVLVFASFYGYGLIVVANSLADSSTTTTYSVEVIDKHATHGRSTSYYLVLEPWGPVEGRNEISVSSTIYEQVSRGDQICLGLHQGRLHAPWYHLADCPAEPDTAPAQ